MFRVSHRISRPPASRIPNKSAQIDTPAAGTAIKTPCKCRECREPKTSSQTTLPQRPPGAQRKRKLILCFLSGLGALCGNSSYDLLKLRQRLFEFDLQNASASIYYPVKSLLDGVEFRSTQSETLSQQTLGPITVMRLADALFRRRNADAMPAVFGGQNENRHKTAFKTDTLLIDPQEIGAL